MFQFLCHLLLTLATLPSCLAFPAATLCPENQTAELGGQGYIICNFPDDFSSVYWYDNTSESSHVVVNLDADNGVKSGPGFEHGFYDVTQNGSLIIPNVTTWHEGVYRVIVYTDVPYKTFLISLKVIASPGDQFPMVVCHNCHQEYYCNVMNTETLSCSFGAARPPVQLEWFEQFSDGYDRVEMEQFISTANRNGTLNSLATVHLPNNNSTSLIHLFMCRATWPPSVWKREKQILLDFSSNKHFSNGTPKTQYMEVYRHAVIPCGGSSSVYVVWKRILSNSDPETIGFCSHNSTETLSNAPDVKVTAEGNLVFSSPQIRHEGMYTCIYGDGQKEGVKMTSVEILIPPSPPYIQITGCDDVSHSCVLKENSTKKLTCAVYGVRPTTSLEWVAEDADQISFIYQKEVPKERVDTSDTIVSVEYKVSPDVLCGEEILIRCHLYGPLSKIMKAEATALVIPASCKENDGKRNHGHGGFITAVVVILCTLSVVAIAALIIMYCNHGYCIKSATTAEPTYHGVATDDPQDASSHTGNE